MSVLYIHAYIYNVKCGLRQTFMQKILFIFFCTVYDAGIFSYFSLEDVICQHQRLFFSIQHFVTQPTYIDPRTVSTRMNSHCLRLSQQMNDKLRLNRFDVIFVNFRWWIPIKLPFELFYATNNYSACPCGQLTVICQSKV